MKLLSLIRPAALGLLSLNACSCEPDYAIEDLTVSFSGQITLYEVGQVPKPVAIESCTALNRFTPDSDADFYDGNGGFHPYNFRLECDDLLIDLLYRPEEREGVDKRSFIRGRLILNGEGLEQGCRRVYFLVSWAEAIITEESTNLTERNGNITSKLPWSVNIRSIYPGSDAAGNYITCAEMDVIFTVEEA